METAQFSLTSFFIPPLYTMDGQKGSRKELKTRKGCDIIPLYISRFIKLRPWYKLNIYCEAVDEPLSRNCSGAVFAVPGESWSGTGRLFLFMEEER